MNFITFAIRKCNSKQLEYGTLYMAVSNIRFPSMAEEANNANFTNSKDCLVWQVEGPIWFSLNKCLASASLAAWQMQ